MKELKVVFYHPINIGDIRTDKKLREKSAIDNRIGALHCPKKNKY